MSHSRARTRAGRDREVQEASNGTTTLCKACRRVFHYHVILAKNTYEALLSDLFKRPKLSSRRRCKRRCLFTEVHVSSGTAVRYALSPGEAPSSIEECWEINMSEEWVIWLAVYLCD